MILKKQFLTTLLIGSQDRVSVTISLPGHGFSQEVLGGCAILHGGRVQAWPESIRCRIFMDFSFNK